MKPTQRMSENMIEEYFIAVNISAIGEPKNLFDSYQHYLSRPWKSLQNPAIPVMRCVADIMEHHDFPLWGKIMNESEVRFVFGNMIVEILCRYFQSKLSLERSDCGEDASLNTSSGSRYDYVMWNLMYTGRTKSSTSIIIFFSICVLSESID